MPLIARNRPAPIVIVLSSVQLLLVLDTTIITSAVPGMTAEFGGGYSPATLSVGAYTLIFGALLLLGGWLADRFGSERVLPCALVMFAVAGVAVVLVHSVAGVLVIRVIQGVAAAAAAPAAVSALLRIPSGRHRSQGLAWFASTGAVGLSLGLGLGSPLCVHTGWRSAFLGPAALAALLVVLSRRLATSEPAVSRRNTSVKELLPLCAGTGIVIGLGELALLISPVWWPPLVMLVIAGGGLAMLVRMDRRRSSPAIPRAMLRERIHRFGLALMAGFGVWQAAEVLLITVQIQGSHHTSSWILGLPFWVQGAAALGAAGLARRHCRHPRHLYAIGIFAPTIATVAFLVLTVDWPPPISVTCAMAALFGVAAVTASTAATIANTRESAESPGRIGAVMTSARQLGTSIATCATGAVLTTPHDAIRTGMAAAAAVTLLIAVGLTLTVKFSSI